jgi:GH18 family chitinase
MSYDSVGRHATYEKAVADIETLLARGAPREKLVMGIPFYGRHTQRDEILSYREILEKYHPEPAADDVADFHFNGLDTIRRKVDYAVKSKIGGVMVWELGQDTRDEKSLLKAIAEKAQGSKQ